MSHTVVSMFEQPQQAQQARNQLLATGFLEKQVQLRTASYKADNLLPEQQQQTDVFDKITAFFKELFAADEQQAAFYTQQARSGTVVAVHTQSRQDAQKAADILDSFGAMDLTGTSDESMQPPGSSHGFLDYPSNIHAENHRKESNARASQLRSRIVERSIESNNNLSS